MGEIVLKVLYVGDGEWVSKTVIKTLGFYAMGTFIDESEFLRKALTSNPEIQVVHMHSHEALESFPRTLNDLQEYDVVILSDVVSDALALYPDLLKVPMGPNRLELIKEFVLNGGGLLMIGGWASFSGYMAQAKYYDTPVEEVLPVEILRYDDRVEVSQGFMFEVLEPNHPIMNGIPWEEADFLLLGYNKVKLKEGAKLLAKYKNDPIIAVWEIRKGRSMVFTSDCAPHWAGSFINWKYYSKFWIQSVVWLAKKM